MVAVCDENEYSPAMRLAEDLGLLVITDTARLDALTSLDVIVDLTPDTIYRQALGPRSSGGAEVVGGAAVGLIGTLLAATQDVLNSEQQLTVVQGACDDLRHERDRLQAREQALVDANTELERHLAEIFFMHEYFRALTTFRSVEDVTSLVVDGTNGILGAEFSAIYLFDQQEWQFRLGAQQGRSEDFFRAEVPFTESILGAAFREGFVQQGDVERGSELTSWSTHPGEIRSQAAIPLRVGDAVVGVLVVASARARLLAASEIERLQGIAQQSSLALHNALMHQRLEHLSITDRLTGLFNHGHLHQRLAEELVRAARFGRTLSVIMLDIDDFKQFNDRFGHPKGDTALRAVGAVIRQNLREIDTAARYGGEEFVVILPESDVSGAVAVAERIRLSMERHVLPVGPDGETVGLTLSLGVASYPAHGFTAAALIEAADQAMYQAKRSGKNRIAVSS